MKALLHTLHKCSKHILAVLSSCKEKMPLMTYEEYTNFVINTYDWSFKSINNVREYMKNKGFRYDLVDKMRDSWEKRIKPELEELFKSLIEENNKNLKY